MRSMPGFFCAAVPCLWNSLPAELRDIQSLCNFKRKDSPFSGRLEPLSYFFINLFY